MDAEDESFMAGPMLKRMQKMVELRQEHEEIEKSAMGVFGLAFGFVLGAIVLVGGYVVDAPWQLVLSLWLLVFSTMVLSLYGLYRKQKRVEQEMIVPEK